MKRSLLARLKHQPDALNGLLSGLTEIQIRQRSKPDKWSIYENIAHLGRYQHVFLERMNAIFKGEQPRFSYYVAENDSGFSDWLNRSFEELLSGFWTDRDTILLFLNHLSNEQTQRLGIHPAYGSMTIEGWTEFFLLHEAHHFFTIFKLAGQMRNNEKVIF